MASETQENAKRQRSKSYIGNGIYSRFAKAIILESMLEGSNSKNEQSVKIKSSLDLTKNEP